MRAGPATAGPPGRSGPLSHGQLPRRWPSCGAMPNVELHLHLHLDCCLSYEAAAKLGPGLTSGQYEQDFTA